LYNFIVRACPHSLVPVLSLVCSVCCSVSHLFFRGPVCSISCLFIFCPGHNVSCLFHLSCLVCLLVCYIFPSCSVCILSVFYVLPFLSVFGSVCSVYTLFCLLFYLSCLLRLSAILSVFPVPSPIGTFFPANSVFRLFGAFLSVLP
jgi:hypothetical protein